MKKGTQPSVFFHIDIDLAYDIIFSTQIGVDYEKDILHIDDCHHNLLVLCNAHSVQ